MYIKHSCRSKILDTWM